MKNSEKTLEMIVNLCKNRGYVYAGSEIYGGLANSWDYGPLGVEFKNNVKKAWPFTRMFHSSEWLRNGADDMENMRHLWSLGDGSQKTEYHKRNKTVLNTHPLAELGDRSRYTLVMIVATISATKQNQSQ